MTRVCVGIPICAQPEQLLATLGALRAHTSGPLDLLLLPDGPDPPTRAALAGLASIPQLASAEPRGAPACFNRLAAASDADVLVLLESGALVGPGWLDYLLAALAADPHNGLAGPSTNRAWNEQATFPRANPASLAAVARLAAERYGLRAQSLEPLYSLADFCYAVRRAVIADIGAADEGYSLGPCWEMDYNIRAARAGWRGVWAAGAFVYRSPSTARRERDEARSFAASKARYQDKFCALRLRGERASYAPHCRGDACEHFAPTEQIQLRLPLMPMASAARAAATPPQHSRGWAKSVPTDGPLISCIMPTRDRATFALQAVAYFTRQDYEPRELIIVDDGDDGLAGLLPTDPRIRYARAPAGASIGAKRNMACTIARGELIAQWDDDDWYAAGRLRAQVAPLRGQPEAISALTTGIFFDLPTWAFWRCTPDLHRRLFVGDVHGGTLVYHRSIWERIARYPDRSLAEDAVFLQQALSRGVRLQCLPGEGLFIYLRHATNSWAFRCGQYLDPAGWLAVPEPPMPPADRAFYLAQAHPAEVLPLVSCIMPTANRRAFVPQAIAYFQRQDYPLCELLIVDDGEDQVADIVPADPRIRYYRLTGRMTIGAKRNYACQQARGDIIAHWDDDDWHAPHRLRYQVEALLQASAELCGINQLLFYDLRDGRAWQYTYTGGQRRWVSGSTLCYRRNYWAQHPFADLNVGEDTRFVWGAGDARIVILPDSGFHIGMIHAHNVSPKRTGGAYWQPYPGSEMRRILGADLGFYDMAPMQDS